MDLSVIKRAPRWAWVTAAGVGIGAAGIKLYKNRAKPAGETGSATASDGSALDSLGNPLPTTTGNPVATIVPPVIIGGQGADTNAGVGELQGLYLGAVQNIIDSYQNVWGPIATASMSILTGNAATIQDLAIAGSAPNSQTQLPAEIVPQAAPPPDAPVAIIPATVPAPAPAAPASPCGDCQPPYPFCNEANGACYTVACATGAGTRRKGRWHLYKTLPDVWIGPTC